MRDAIYPIVLLTFVNRTAAHKVISMHVERQACEHIARWYGAFYAGDDYDVFIDGAPIEKDIDGALATDPNNRL